MSIITIGIVGLCWPALAQNMLWETLSRAGRVRGILVKPDVFERDNVYSHLSQYLGQVSHAVEKIVFLTDESQRWAVVEQGDTSFDLFTKHRAEVARADIRVAEMTVAPLGSVLRVRNGSVVTRRVVKGVDPLIFECGDRKCEVVFLSLTNRGVEAFVSAQRMPSVAEASELFTKIASAFDGHLAYLAIREDTWFFTDSSFPLRYWFDTTTPDSSAIYKSPQISCSVASACRLAPRSTR